jgi:hypothetical protein
MPANCVSQGESGGAQLWNGNAEKANIALCGELMREYKKRSLQKTRLEMKIEK